MKKWWIAFGIEFVLCVALLVGYSIYHKQFEEKKQQVIAMRQEQEQREEERRKLEEKAKEEARIQEVKDSIVSACKNIDVEFAEWLYTNYQKECEAIATAVMDNAYEDKIWYQKTGKSIFVLRDEFKGILESKASMLEYSIYMKESASSDYASLSFAGDISFANDYAPAQNYTREGINGAFTQDVQATMRAADVFMLNNEFCYTTSNTPISGKTYTFRADPKLVTRLDEMGVDIVSIANNHTYDYGAQGFLDTLTTLKEANMPYVGGGENLEDARNNIVYFIMNGMKIGYIAATQVERDLPILTQPATEDSPGVIRCFEPELVNEMITEAKNNCDFVIVYPHWGTELVKEIQSDQQALAYSFIDAGADAIVGGHPHCLQGVEYYKDVPIFYSLSNFSFSSKVVDSSILNLQVTIDGIQKAQYIPCRESYGTTYRCEKGDDDYNQILDLLNRVSANAQIDEDGYVTQRR